MVKHFVILGYGITGRSILKFLLTKYAQTEDICVDGYKLLLSIFDDNILNKQEIVDNISNQFNQFNQLVEINVFNNLNDLIKLNNSNKISLIITSPGIKPKRVAKVLAVSDIQAVVVSDLELFIQQPEINPDNIYGITGTNGKSTACHLLNFILESYYKVNNLTNKIALGGNYGTPVLDFVSLDSLDSINSIKYTDYILELSSYQLALTKNFNCLSAVCLNISIDHIDWHGSYENYVLDKLKIYEHSKFDIINLDQTELVDLYIKNVLAGKIKLNQSINIITYSINNKDFNVPKIINKNILELTIQDNIINLNNHKILDISLLPSFLQAHHNLSNLLAVLSLALAKYVFESCGLQHVTDLSSRIHVGPKYVEYLQQCLSNIKNYVGLPHRCELIAQSNGIKIFNDSKSTNLDASIVAINSVKSQIKGKIWLIIGGIIKDDVDDLASQQMFCQSLDNCIAGIIVFGKEIKFRAKLVNIAKNNLNYQYEVIEITEENNIIALDKIIRVIFSRIKPFDAILFSPACASFDMFNNYIHRGELFCQQINKYLNGETIN